MTMRWLITGANGMLGTDLQRALRDQGDEVVPVDLPELDITDPAAVTEFVADVEPAVIVNCAAFTRVDDCESNEGVATAVNGSALEFLAAAANRSDSLLVQISTDFVFNGASRAPYEVNDAPDPISAYGRSKLLGEQLASEARKHAIVRTAWLFGRSGWNFVEAIRSQIVSGRSEISVVDDQVGRPTYTAHLAKAVMRIARRGLASEEARGIFHYSDAPSCSWFEFAKAILATMQERGAVTEPVTILPVSSEAFPRPARRPNYSVLSTSRYERITGALPASWREGLEEYFGEVSSPQMET